MSTKTTITIHKNEHGKYKMKLIDFITSIQPFLQVQLQGMQGLMFIELSTKLIKDGLDEKDMQLFQNLMQTVFQCEVITN